MLIKTGEDVPIEDIEVIELKEKIKEVVDVKSDDHRNQIGEPSNKKMKKK